MLPRCPIPATTASVPQSYLDQSQQHLRWVRLAPPSLPDGADCEGDGSSMASSGGGGGGGRSHCVTLDSRMRLDRTLVRAVMRDVPGGNLPVASRSQRASIRTRRSNVTFGRLAPMVTASSGVPSWDRTTPNWWTTVGGLLRRNPGRDSQTGMMLDRILAHACRSWFRRFRAPVHVSLLAGAIRSQRTRRC